MKKSKIQNFYDSTFLPALTKDRPYGFRVTVGVLRYSECKENRALNRNFNVCGAIQLIIVKLPVAGELQVIPEGAGESFYILVARNGDFALATKAEIDGANAASPWSKEVDTILSITEQNKRILNREVRLLATNDIDKIMEILFS